MRSSTYTYPCTHEIYTYIHTYIRMHIEQDNISTILQTARAGELTMSKAKRSHMNCHLLPCENILSDDQSNYSFRILSFINTKK